MRVVIVGAGLSGLTLAAFLRELNIDVVVVDQSPYLQATYISPYSLFANAISCFNAFRLGHILAENSSLNRKNYLLNECSYYMGDERYIYSQNFKQKDYMKNSVHSDYIDYTAEKYFGLMNINREWMLQITNRFIHLDALRPDDLIPLTTSPFANSTSPVSRDLQEEQLQQMGHVPLRITLPASQVRENLRRQVAEMRFGCRVVDLIPHDGIKGGVHVVLEDGRTEWGDIVVGADGMFSTIRRLLYPNEEINITSDLLGERHVHGYVDLPVPFVLKTVSDTNSNYVKREEKQQINHTHNNELDNTEENRQAIKSELNVHINNNHDNNQEKHIETEKREMWSDNMQREVHTTEKIRMELCKLFRTLRWPVEIWGNREMLSLHSYTEKDAMRLAFSIAFCGDCAELSKNCEKHDTCNRSCFSLNTYNSNNNVIDNYMFEELNNDNIRQVLSKRSECFGLDISFLLEHATLAQNFKMIEAPIMPRWYNKRAVLIGDAAHSALPSSLQQDASLCIEDAAILATVLADIPFLRDSGVEYVFERYETLRRARVEQYIRQSRRVKRFMTTSHVTARNAVLSCLPGWSFSLYQGWLSNWTYSAQKADVSAAVKREIFMR